MTAHPPSDPAAEAEIALRKALARHFDPAAFQRSGQGPDGGHHYARRRNSALTKADLAIAGPLAPLLADIAALRTRAEEAEARAESWKATAEAEAEIGSERAAERDAAIKTCDMAAMSGGFYARTAENMERRAIAAEALSTTLAAELAESRAEMARQAARIFALEGAVRGLLIWVDEPAEDDDLCGIARQDRRVEAARRALKPEGASDHGR